jgi:hypothetical protein
LIWVSSEHFLEEFPKTNPLYNFHRQPKDEVDADEEHYCRYNPAFQPFCRLIIRAILLTCLKGRLKK